MNARYFVKTRNWHCKKLVFRLLSATPTVQRGDDYDDGDGKFYVETNSPIFAALVLLYFKALEHWSGGWTYVRSSSFSGALVPGKSLFI